MDWRQISPGRFMIFITCVISTNEWIELHEQASRFWPGEELSRGEVMRRLSLVGCDRIGKTTAQERQAMAESSALRLIPITLRFVAPCRERSKSM